MSEMPEVFNLLHEVNRVDGRERKVHNKQNSTALLEQRGVHFTSKNNGVHLIVEHKGRTVDYWPSTGLFIDRANNHRSRGVFKLLRYLNTQRRG